MAGVLKLTVAYDGTGFCGSQTQINGRSVQAELERSVAQLFGQPTPVVLSGRTDAGVHAVGQVASVADHKPHLPAEQVIRALNAHLDDDLAVVACERREAGFHARFDAVWREYRYRIVWGTPQPLLRRRVDQRPFALDIVRMGAGATHLHGEVDLASFTGNGMGVAGGPSAGPRVTVRTIHHCSVTPIEPGWGAVPNATGGCDIRIIADGFLPQVVRTIAGALIDVGRGYRPPEWIAQLLAVKDRRAGPKTAPPHGLILWRVGYDHALPDELNGTAPSGCESVASRADS